ncbi:MAG: ATP-binding protein [Pseudomonadota bacterium]
MLSSDRLLSLINNFPDAMVATDLDRKIVKVNDTYTRLFGYTEEESLGKSTMMLYSSPEDFYKTGKTRFNTEVEPTREHYVIEYKRKDGSSFLGETAGVPIMDENGEKIGFIGVIRDITMRRYFDDSVYKFQMVTSSNEYDTDYKIDRVLEITCEYLGLDFGILSHIEGDAYTIQNCYSKDGSLDKGLAFELGETYCHKTYLTSDVIAYDNVATSDIQNHPCHKKFNLNAYIGISVDVGGQKYGTLNFTSSNSRKKPFTQRDRDICTIAASWISYALTKEIHSAELIEAREEAEEANKAKTHFIANISHEVRTPLNGIMGYADILANMIDDPDVKNLSGKIQSSANALLDILNDVIDISKIEHGEFQIVRSSYSPQKIIKDVIDLFEAPSKNKGNDLIVKLDPSMPQEVIGDGSRLKQVLSNLISNAIKFTNDGQVKVSALYDTKKQNIRIQISDTGIGIAEDMKEKVFEDYIQADSGVTKTYGGTGLGLSICKKLIEMMNGSIKLDSKLGLGTSVTISIPANAIEKESTLESSHKATKPNKRDESHKQKEKPNILLVEDIQMNIEIATAMLYRADCNIDVAKDGMTALDKVQSFEYDVIFLDIQMPDMDGITVAKEMRKLGVTSPIIAVTAHVMSHEIAEFMKSGMDDYLPKPIIYNDLQKTLSTWA